MIIFILTGPLNFATDCIIDEATKRWPGSISFHCNQATNLSINSINLELLNGVKISSVWNSIGETILSKNIV